MGSKDQRVDAYIARSADFAQPILRHVRKLVHVHCPAVTETIKWGFPHFDYQGRIFCSMAAFKAHCAVGFWLGDLLNVDASAEKAMGQFGRITALGDLPGDKDFGALVKQAMALQDSGAKSPARQKKPVGEKPQLAIPAPFLAAVKKNRKALATFEAFPGSKKREYVEWYVEAKTDATRDKRLAQAIEWMAEGKSRHWKYQKS